MKTIQLLLAFCLANFTQFGFAQDKQLQRAQSYQAHIGAASHAIRLHETADANHWLQQAPKELRGWEWNYLQQQTMQAHAGFGESTETVKVMSISPNGLWLATADKDKKVRVIELGSGKELWSFFDKNLSPQSLTFHPVQPLLGAAFSKHTVKIWDVSTGKEQHHLQGAGRGITAIAFSPDGKDLASASWNHNKERGVWGIVEIWDHQTGASIRKLEYGTKPLVSIAYSPDGQYLAVGSWEVQKTVAFWNTKSWGAAELLSSEDNDQYKAVQSIQFSPDSHLLAAGGKDGKIRIWNMQSRQRLHSLGDLGRGHTKWVNSIAFSPDGKFLVSASTDQTVRIWDVQKGSETAVLHAHTKGVQSVAYSPDGSYFLSAAAPEIKRWNSDQLPGTGRSTALWKHPASVYGIHFSPDGKYAYTAAWQGGIKIWDTSKSEMIAEWQGHQSSVNAVSISNDQSRLASVGNDGHIKIWERASPTLPFQLHSTLDEVKTNQLVAVQLLADGKQVFAASNAGSAKVWDIAEKKVVLTLKHEKNISTTAMSSDQKYLATGAQDGSVKVWDAKTGRQLYSLTHHKGQIHALSFNPQSTYLAIASGDASLSQVELKKNGRVQHIEAHDETAYSVAYSPDGKRLVSASADQTVKLWDTQRLQQLLSIDYESPVYQAQFSPDGKTLYTLPMDGSVRVLKGHSAFQ